MADPNQTVLLALPAVASMARRAMRPILVAVIGYLSISGVEHLLGLGVALTTAALIFVLCVTSLWASGEEG